MRDTRIGRDQVGQRRRSEFRFDPLLVTFLVVGWLLIFATATFALQRDSQGWLPVELVPRVVADYSVDAAGAARLAPVRPEIVAAVKQDALVSGPPATSELLAETTPEKLSLLVFGPTRTPTGIVSATLTLTSTELKVNAGGPYTGKEGSPIALVAGAAGLEPGAVSYVWDLDEDGLYDDAQGKWATAIFYDEGEYEVGVQASDGAGHVARAVARVSVANVAPGIYGVGDGEAGEGERVSFSATVVDPGHDVLLYTWDFGDGSGEQGTLKPEHTYVDDGEYVVRLRAEDNDGGVGEALFVMRVRNVPPEVEAGADQETEEGAEVTFSGRARDAGVHDRLSYAWDLDYDGVSFRADVSGATASTVYADGPADIVAALRVRDGDGGETLDTLRVRVNNVAPRIVDVRDDGPVGEGSPMTLTVSATDVGSDVLTYAYDWDNDGVYEAVGQPASVSHVWNDEGEYTVGVMVDDGDGGVVYSTKLVTAYNVAPVAVAGSPGAQLEGTPVTLDGSGSWDAGIYDVLSYEWEFGDGSPVASGMVVGHAYGDNRVYSATLRVTDDSGAVGTAEVGVSILNANPVAEAGGPYAGDEGEPITLTGTGIDVPADVLTYEWDVDGDGSYELVGRNVVTSWNREGRYQVVLQVWDDDGGVGLDTAEVRIDNAPPVAEAGGPYTGAEGEAIVLTGTASDPTNDPLTYAWDLDYDSVFETPGQVVSYTWPDDGQYTVSLRVDDGRGGVDTDDATVIVANVPPTISAGGPYTATVGITFTLVATATDVPADPLTYTWDLDDDGTFDDGAGAQVTYIWTATGIYTVTLRVDDGDGGVVTDVTTVNVSTLVPLAWLGVSYFLVRRKRPYLLSNSG